MNRGAATILIIGICALTGCSMFNRGGAIKAPGVTVQGIPDAGKPASLATSQAGVGIALGAGSHLVITKVAAIPATKDAPAQPAKEITEIYPSAPTEYRKTESTVTADTGTVDTSVALKKVEAQENRILLYGALGMVVAAAAFFWLHYPSPALMCAGGSVILFLAWKVSGLPSWFWGLAVLAGAGGAGLYFGHNRGLYEPVPDKTNTP